MTYRTYDEHLEREAQAILEELRARQEHRNVLTCITDALLLSIALLAYTFTLWGILATKAPWVFF